jgi:fucose 4-O-acetylase-like acetyltransferase
MQTAKKVFKELILPLILCWFLMTIFVDIFTIPTVFRTLNNVEAAGKVGMKVFGAFNCFELVFATIILIASLIRFPSRKVFYFALPLFTLSLLYNFYMTPMITNLTGLIHATAVSDPQYAIFQSEHAKFHNLYRQFDTAKILGLLIFFIVMLVEKVRTKNPETL